MLIVQRVTKNEETGKYDTSWSLDEEQVSFLMSYAINDLLSKGLVTIEQVPEKVN